MSLELCSNCGRMHYSTDPCRDKPSYAGLVKEADLHRQMVEELIAEPARTSSSPAKRDRKDYMRTYMANKRAKAKLANTSG